MRVVILTWGSMGDVMPLVALARKLMEDGCDVTFGASSVFSGFLERKGIPYIQIGRPFTAGEYNELMERVIAEPNPRKQFRLLVKEALLSDLDTQYQDSLDAIADADVVVGHWMQIAGIMAAEKKDKLLVTVTLNPVGIENMYGNSRQKGGEERTSSNVGLSLSDLLWGNEIHEFRARVGLKSINSVSEAQYSQRLNLVAVSRHVLPGHRGWPKNHQPAGFWYVDEEEAWTPGPELLEFLESGEKPVVVSFGSMAGEDSDGTTRILLDAIRTRGERAILQAGWGELGNSRLSENILRIDYAPHCWLFSRASCIVHHGGAGTTAAALRAGVPSVVVWHMLDQPYWGIRLESLGLGPKPLARYKLTADGLAESIREVLESSLYSDACQDMAVRLAAESGVQEAAERISKLLK